MWLIHFNICYIFLRLVQSRPISVDENTWEALLFCCFTDLNYNLQKKSLYKTWTNDGSRQIQLISELREVLMHWK